MRALRFSSFSGVEALKLETLQQVLRAPSEVIVEVRAASINPSDVKNVQGIMHGTTLPRTPGRDFAGVVVDGSEHMLSKYVWGAGGEIGFTRDGSHAEYLLLPESAVCEMPENFSFTQAAAAGVAFVTAWSGVHDVLQLQAGQTIVVSGANGAVGSAVLQLARWMGATTIAVVRKRTAAIGTTEMLSDHIVASDQEHLTEALRELAPHGRIDAVFDTVGEPVFTRLLDALGDGGRYAVIANTGEKHVPLEIVAFYRKRLHLGGVDSRAIDATSAGRILARIRPGFESGALLPPRVDRTVGLASAIEAYREIAEGSTQKIVIAPQASGDSTT